MVSGTLHSVVYGAACTELAVRALRSYSNVEVGNGQRATPAWLIGTIERLFFTFIVAFEISATAVAMIAWLTTKMVTGWNRPGAANVTSEGALTALLGGLISMFFALIGGLICAGKI
ncbi:MAG TPA: hypothetical protein VJU84_06885 [Pyrinomonadaceae bacterium]|nr:hypothetical protein [Pyrinomonadaceae bacterium]